MKYLFGIIICTYNRCDSLKKTLESLIKQECEWGSVAEIIIVDNNSTDSTEKLVHSYTASFQTECNYLKEKKQGKSHALNLAILTSKSDVLVFTDDDVIFDARWLNEIMLFFENNEVDILGGRVLPIFPPNTPRWIKENQYALRGPIGFYDNGENVIEYGSGKVTEFPGANVAYKKDVFETIGLYNTHLGPGSGTVFEDIEMFQRAIQACKKIVYNGKALLWHKNPKQITLRYVTKWNFQHGKSAAIIEAMKTKQKFSFIGGIPRHLFRSLALRLIELFLTFLKPKLFLKRWCAFYFNLGMIAGYAKFRQFDTPQKD